MGRGRKAKPQKVIDLMGGRAHSHRAPRNEVHPPSNIPTCPAHLDTKAQNEWKRVAPLLDSVGIITELDRSTLAAYCEAYSRWVNAIVKVRDMGDVYAKGREFGVINKKKVILKVGVLTLNPYVRIAKEAEDCMRKNASLLAMNPASRASLSIANIKPKQKDPYEEFLAKKAQN